MFARRLQDQRNVGLNETQWLEMRSRNHYVKGPDGKTTFPRILARVSGLTEELYHLGRT
jgi:hypothetical protein